MYSLYERIYNIIHNHCVTICVYCVYKSTNVSNVRDVDGVYFALNDDIVYIVNIVLFVYIVHLVHIPLISCSAYIVHIAHIV